MKNAPSLVLLILLASVLLFGRLGTVSLWNNNEPRYAHTARNMLERGDWITPIYKGKLRSDKPILTYWLIMLSSEGINHGRVDELSARLPFAILGILGIMVIFLFGAQLGGTRVGFISGLALLFTLEYIVTARRCLPDMALNFFIILTIFLFYKGYTSYKRQGLYYLLSYASAGLGFLAKGPVAVVIPGGVVFLYLALSHDLKEVKNLRILPGLFLFLAIVLPWFLAVTPEFSKEFFLLHNLKHGLKGLDHQKPWYFYFEAIPVPFAPTLYFLPAGIWLWWSQKKRRETSSLLLPLIWALFPFILFSLAAAKRVIYLLPMAPPLALLTGLTIDKLLQGETDKTFRILMHIGTVSGFLALISVPFTTYYFNLKPDLWVPVLALIPTLCLILHLKKTQWIRSLACLGLLFFLSYTAYFFYFQPQYDRLHRSAKPLARRILAIVDDAPLYRMGPFDAALEFYLGRLYIPKLSPKELDKLLEEKRENFYVITQKKFLKRVNNECRSKLKLISTFNSRGKRFVLLEKRHGNTPIGQQLSKGTKIPAKHF